MLVTHRYESNPKPRATEGFERRLHSAVGSQRDSLVSVHKKTISLVVMSFSRASKLPSSHPRPGEGIVRQWGVADTDGNMCCSASQATTAFFLPISAEVKRLWRVGLVGRTTPLSTRSKF